MAAYDFATVRHYLDEIMTAWAKNHGREPDLPGAHGDPTMGWETKEQLAASAPFGMPLIEQGVAGADTNLVLALRTGVPGFPRMPLGGPFMPDDQIQYISDWIDAGMPG
jgi:hypothetical protein